MGERDAVARPYAHALIAATPHFDRTFTCLQNAADAVSAPEIAALITDPRLDSRALADALVLGSDAACEAVGRLIRLMLENGRLSYLPDVARVFVELRDAREGRNRAHITSAHPLTDAEQKTLLARLGRRLGGTIELSIEVDPALMAGAIVQIGDTVLDGSVRGRLQALRQTVGLP